MLQKIIKRILEKKNLEYLKNIWKIKLFKKSVETVKNKNNVINSILIVLLWVCLVLINYSYIFEDLNKNYDAILQKNLDIENFLESFIILFITILIFSILKYILYKLYIYIKKEAKEDEKVMKEKIELNKKIIADLDNKIKNVKKNNRKNI